MSNLAVCRFTLFLWLTAGVLTWAAAAVAGGYSALVIDADSGAVLHEDSANEPRYPASLTKMMTLLMVFDALQQGRLNLYQPLYASARAASKPPSKLGIKPGQSLTVEEAIMALTTCSANDVATVIAESMAGSEQEFAAQMTNRAHSLGMTQSNFVNASGLPDPYQVTTAWDLVRLAQVLQTQHRQYYRYFSTREFYFGRQVFRNHNRLLYDYPGTDGIKTGFIRSAGYNLVASAQRSGRRLIGVVLGGTSRQDRNEDMRYLLDNGFAKLGVEGPVYAATPYGGGRAGVWRNVSSSPPATALNQGPAQSRPIPYVSSSPPATAFNRGPAQGRPIPYSNLQRVTTTERVRATFDPNDAWKVDVGLFDSRNEAQQQVEQIIRLAPQLLTYDQVTLRNVNHDGRRLVRVIFDNLSRENAGYACRTLRQQQQDCILLPPGT